MCQERDEILAGLDQATDLEPGSTGGAAIQECNRRFIGERHDPVMNSLASTIVQMQAATLNQQVGTAVVRQQLDAQRAVADLVAGTAAAASPLPPPGQGLVVDKRV